MQLGVMKLEEKESNFGRRREDQVGIVELFAEMQELNRTLYSYHQKHAEEISELKQVMNNGIVKRTKENTEAIEFLADEVQEVRDVVQEKEQFKKGKMSTWQLVKTILASVGSTLVAVLSILWYLGVIF